MPVACCQLHSICFLLIDRPTVKVRITVSIRVMVTVRVRAKISVRISPVIPIQF